MMVVVEGSWGSKQLGHIAKFCPQKDQPATNTATTAATTNEGKEKNPGPVQPKTNEGWTEVTQKKGKKGIPQKQPDPFHQLRKKNSDPVPATSEPAPATLEPAPETVPAILRSPEKPSASAPAPSPTAKASSKKKKNRKLITEPATEPQEIPMAINVKLKRRRNSGEGSSKRYAPIHLPNKIPWKAHLICCHNLPYINFPNINLAHINLHNNFPNNNK